MNTFITIAQIASAIFLILAILAQNRGSGLSATFGGSGGFYRSKRGMEKILSYTTIVLVVIFLSTSFLSSLLNK